MNRLAATGTFAFPAGQGGCDSDAFTAMLAGKTNIIAWKSIHEELKVQECRELAREHTEMREFFCFLGTKISNVGIRSCPYSLD
jgi:hypothetical protein